MNSASDGERFPARTPQVGPVFGRIDLNVGLTSTAKASGQKLNIANGLWTSS